MHQLKWVTPKKLIDLFDIQVKDPIRSLNLALNGITQINRFLNRYDITQQKTRLVSESVGGSSSYQQQARD